MLKVTNNIFAKKNSTLYILEILSRKSDQNNSLTIATISKELEKNYQLKMERKAIKRALENLYELGSGVEYHITTRQKRDGAIGELDEVKTGWYVEKDFSDEELRLMIESVLFSKYIPAKFKSDMITNVEKLGSQQFKSRVRHAGIAVDNSLDAQEVLLNVDMIDEAVSRNKKIAFHYNYYKADKQKHKYKNSNGQVREYIVNPYYIVSSNDRYYLICNYENNDELHNYRLDRIVDMQILEDIRKPIEKVKAGKGFNLSKYMQQHLYMFSGEALPVQFWVKAAYVDEVIDWFGKSIVIMKQEEGKTLIRAVVNENAMRVWAVQYGKHVQVTKPERLKDNIKADLQQALDGYK